MGLGEVRGRRLHGLAKAAALSIAVFFAGSQAEAAKVISIAPVGVFNSLEFATNATQGLGNWTRAQRKLGREARVYELCDSGDVACPKQLKAWRHELARLHSLTREDQIAGVNSFANKAITYVDDVHAFGQADLWATPAQSLKGKGDCEDYAILKYASLRALGFAEQDLRLVIVDDERRKLGHAVLSVKLGAETYILDNQDNRILRHDAIAYYAPIYSVNAAGRWVNIATRDLRRKPTQTQLVASAEELEQPAVPLKRLTPRLQATATAALLRPSVSISAREPTQADGSQHAAVSGLYVLLAALLQISNQVTD